MSDDTPKFKIATLSPGENAPLFQMVTAPKDEPMLPTFSFHPGDVENRDESRYRHDLSVPAHKKNFDQKVFMFPESYNQLRKELAEHYPNLWRVVQWRMAYRAEEFIEQMNDALDMKLVFDTEKVDWICKQYLNKLRQKRGLHGF